MIQITVAIVFHSGCGHTARQAEAARRGVEKVAARPSSFLPPRKRRPAGMTCKKPTRLSLKAKDTVGAQIHQDLSHSN